MTNEWKNNTPQKCDLYSVKVWAMHELITNISTFQKTVIMKISK